MNNRILPAVFGAAILLSALWAGAEPLVVAAGNKENVQILLPQDAPQKLVEALKTVIDYNHFPSSVRVRIYGNLDGRLSQGLPRGAESGPNPEEGYFIGYVQDSPGEIVVGAAHDEGIFRGCCQILGSSFGLLDPGLRRPALRWRAAPLDGSNLERELQQLAFRRVNMVLLPRAEHTGEQDLAEMASAARALYFEPILPVYATELDLGNWAFEQAQLISSLDVGWVYLQTVYPPRALGPHTHDPLLDNPSDPDRLNILEEEVAASAAHAVLDALPIAEPGHRFIAAAQEPAQEEQEPEQGGNKGVLFSHGEAEKPESASETSGPWNDQLLPMFYQASTGTEALVRAGQPFFVAYRDVKYQRPAWEELGDGSTAANAGLILFRRPGRDLAKLDERSWRSDANEQPWPAGLNSYFSTRFWKPDYETMLNAMVVRANRTALAGASPAEERRRFAAALAEMPSEAQGAQLERARSLYENLLTWQRLEASFHLDGSEAALGKLTDLLARQLKLDPQFDQRKLETLTAAIEQRKAFAPSTVVFRRFVLPYRPVEFPEGTRPFPLEAEAAYEDRKGRSAAEMDFGAPVGPVFRVDFETAAAKRIEAQTSPDGTHWETVQVLASQENGELHGPLIFEEPFVGRRLRLEAEAGGVEAFLRDVRAAGLKEPAVIHCPRVVSPPVLDGDFKEPPWPRKPQGMNFVAARPLSIAAVQTTVRAVRDEHTLYIAAYMREPRMKDLVAAASDADASLEGTESFEISLFPTNVDRSINFVANAAGARREFRGGAEEWDAHWRCVVRKYSQGWALEAAIPFETIGLQPHSGEDWRVNFHRRRRNVVNADSSWSYPGNGRMVFE